ncbi:MAG TPA: AAA family ATPase [Thermoguttaceae bacterium]|nr:AAA family ATPase [Thermoguttaceae bacterium]
MGSEMSAAQRAAFRQQMAQLVAGNCHDVDGRDMPQATALAPRRQTGPPWKTEAIFEPQPAERRRDPLSDTDEGQDAGQFTPLAPNSLAEAGIDEAWAESLILKFLVSRPIATGRETSQQIKLPFRITSQVLRRLKESQLVVYKNTASVNDYVYEITAAGFDRARRFMEQSTYFGAAPVPLSQYVAAVRAQSIRNRLPRFDQLEAAFADLMLDRTTLSQLGQAIASGLGLFLYGPSGNGKTSIAERITRALGEGLWIPYAISVASEIVRLYDPNLHEPLPPDGNHGQLRDELIDNRWVRIRRPTVIVGGELTMDHLEITVNKATGINEAPLQWKSNGGTLVIDDFGRQRISPAELLNRWIVPLERRCDYLNLPSGRKIEVPFDQLIVFSTNLEPRELVDEAFLRRIPYKIEVRDPTESEFRRLFEQTASRMGIDYRSAAVDNLLQTHYQATGRPLRFCHVQDLLHQVRIYCQFHAQPPTLTTEALDAAVRNYFAMI